MYEFIEPAGALPAHTTVGLVITTYNRPRLTARCFRSLRRSHLGDTAVVVVDDGSDDHRTRQLVAGLEFPDVPIIKAFRRRHEGFNVHESLRLGWELLLDRYHCRYLANLDADVVVKADWLRRVLALFQAQRPLRGPLLVTGFNAHTHPVFVEESDYRIKASIGGLQTLFDPALYQEVIRPHLRVNWDDHVVAVMRVRGYPLLCTKPSVVQHLGRTGHYSNLSAGYDVAYDFWGADPGRVWLLRHWFLLQRLLRVHWHRVRPQLENGLHRWQALKKRTIARLR